MEYKSIPNLEEALNALGEILDYESKSFALVVVGGAALQIQGYVQRVTRDVDIIALGLDLVEGSRKIIQPPDQLPASLINSISRVARDFNLPDDWINTTVSLQWKTGLPPGFADRIHWQQYGGLKLGLADRYDLIFLKLFAAADSGGPSSVHYQDLIALNPTHEELDAASQWVMSQDTSVQFAQILSQVVDHAKRDI